MAPGPEEKNHDSSESDYDNCDTGTPTSTASESDVTLLTNEDAITPSDGECDHTNQVTAKVTEPEVSVPDESPSTVKRDGCTPETECPVDSISSVPASSEQPPLQDTQPQKDDRTVAETDSGETATSQDGQVGTDEKTEWESTPDKPADSDAVAESTEGHGPAAPGVEETQAKVQKTEHSTEEQDLVPGQPESQVAQADSTVEKDETPKEEDEGPEKQENSEHNVENNDQQKEGSQQEEGETKAPESVIKPLEVEGVKEGAAQEETPQEETTKEETTKEETSPEETPQEETPQGELAQESEEQPPEPEPPKQYDPFNPTDPDSEDSDSDDTPSDTTSPLKPTPSRPGMPLLPALGRKLLLTSPSGTHPSPAEAEWHRQKTVLGEKSKALDKLMSMVGLEEVKQTFLAIKSMIATARHRKGKLRRQDLNLVLMGNAGTGKRTLGTIYRDLLTECGVWVAEPCWKTESGYNLQNDRDVEVQLHIPLKDMVGGADVMLFIDAVEGVCWSSRAYFLHVLEFHASRLNLVVMIAGTVDGVNKLLASRPNGRWVFPRQLQLKDYDDEQLRLILLQLIKHNSFTPEGGDDGAFVKIASKRVGRGRGSYGFANVYDLILAFGKMVDRQAARLKKEGVNVTGDKGAAADKKVEEEKSEGDAQKADPAPEPEEKQASEKKPAAENTSDAPEKEDSETAPEESEALKTEEKPSEDGSAAQDTSHPEIPEEKEDKGADEKGPDEAQGPAVNAHAVDANVDITGEGETLTNSETKLEVEENSPSENTPAAVEKAVPQTSAQQGDASGAQKEKEPANDSTAQKAEKVETSKNKEDGEKTTAEDKGSDETQGSASDAPPLDNKEDDTKVPERDVNRVEQKPAFSAAADAQPMDKTGSTEIERGDKATEKKPDSPEMPDQRLFVLKGEDLIGPEPEDIRSTSEAWKELEKMAGLENVKKAIGELLTRAKANYRRELLGKEPLQTSLNRVFLGPPGTGKTTVAKLYGKILAEIGLLSTKEVVYKTPADFIGQYIGESEAKTSEILESTIGKVLIIDDAHMFYQGGRGGGDDTDIYRVGCIDTIIAKIHNKPGEDRCVILLGYPDMMEEMFRKVNPGLKRRFPLEEAFRFESYDDECLNKILRLKMENEDITATEQAMEVAAEVLRRARDRPNFGNGGDVDNLLNQAKTRFRERMTAEKKVASASIEASNSTPDSDPSFILQLQPPMVLAPADFDPEWNRGTLASTKTQSLFAGLIGFESIIDKFQGYQLMAANLRRRGRDPRQIVPFTFIFKGPPGTGKTHTARIVGQIFYDMGFLSTPEVVECSASALIGQYLGHTAPKVVDLFERALGKVLFIDEAYRLANGTCGASTGASFEAEAIGEIVDCMTKPRYLRKMIIVLAGYDKDMDTLMKANAGLRGRFATEIAFPAMSATRMKEHLVNLLKKEEIEVRDEEGDPGVEDKKQRLLRGLRKLGSTAGWSNGRDIKTLADVITGSVYKNAVLEDGEDAGAMFKVSTAELNKFVQDMLMDRMGSLAAVPGRLQ